MKNSSLPYSPVTQHSNQSFWALRVLKTFLILCCALFIFPLAHAGEADKSSYVWALQGVNLRDSPSASGHVITKLNYGTAVTVLAQDDNAAPYEMEFFPKIGSSTAETGAKPILSGAWIKVKANDQQGYVFNKLLLTYPPAKKNEGPESYFARIFGLTATKGAKKNAKEGTEETNYTSTGARKIQMKVILYVQSSGSVGNIFIPDMSFDDAFVLVNALLPPELGLGYTYGKGTSFEYSLRDGGAGFLKEEKGGVEVEWGFEP